MTKNNTAASRHYACTGGIEKAHLRRHTASSRSKEAESHFVSQCLILPHSVHTVTVFDLLEYCRDSKVVSLAELQGIAPKSLRAFSRIKGKTQSFPTGPSFIWYGNIKGKQCIYFSYSNQPPATRNTENRCRNNVTSGAYTPCFSITPSTLTVARRQTLISARMGDNGRSDND
jgi:hypothetical protein